MDAENAGKIQSLREANNIADLASALGVNQKLIPYILYASTAPKYEEFFLAKKTGGTRRVLAPIGQLKRLQRECYRALKLFYRPRSCVKGFVDGQSIVTNAQTHVRSRAMLNVDLADFFPTINFGRVRGALMAKPFLLNPKVATYIAQIACHDNALPQGSPLSPLLSNVICGRLDGQLLRLAKKYKCKYTRYADDITFSTTRKKLPPQLASMADAGAGFNVTLGSDLENIIVANGFRPNQKKTRLQSRSKRLEVTGLTVNKSPNVQRQYIRNLRAICHAIEKYGISAAEREHHQKFYAKHRESAAPPPLSQILKGKLAYVKMVKGEADPVYRRIANKIHICLGLAPLYVNDPFEDLHNSLWILESDEQSQQGTGFYLRGYGIVTCAHVLAKDTVLFRQSATGEKYPAVLLNRNDDLDIALLKVPDGRFQSLERGSPDIMELGDDITLSGFPNYRYGDTPYITGGKISAFRVISTFRRMLINAPIIAGNSGGPVLNNAGQVIGIAATGSDNMAKSVDTENHGVIPINAIDVLASRAAGTRTQSE